MNQDVTSSATTKLPGQNAPASRPKAPKTARSYQKHGLSKLIRTRRKAGMKQFDGRSAFVLALNAYKSALIASLGGADNLSEQELTIVDLISRDVIVVEQIDAYLVQHEVVNKKKRCLYPIALQRMALAESVTKRLAALGLARRSKQVQTLTQLLNASPEPPSKGAEA